MCAYKHVTFCVRQSTSAQAQNKPVRFKLKSGLVLLSAFESKPKAGMFFKNANDASRCMLFSCTK